MEEPDILLAPELPFCIAKGRAVSYVCTVRRSDSVDLVDNLFYEVRQLVFGLGVFAVGVTVFLCFLLLITFVGIETQGLNCDTYTAERLLEWMPSLAEKCAPNTTP